MKNKICVVLKKLLVITLPLLKLLTWQMRFNDKLIMYWRANQPSLSKSFTKTKIKPQMHCNGKCYLYQRLQKETV